MSEPLDWKQVFSTWERAVGKPLEELVKTDGFADALAAWVATQDRVRRELETAGERWLHLWNMPSAGDVRSLQEQVQSLRQEVRDLRRELKKAV